MNTDVAPTFKKLFGAHWLLWYKTSNSYSIVEPEFKKLLDAYLEAKTQDEFLTSVSNDNSVSDFTSYISENLFNYLKASNQPYTPSQLPSVVLDCSNRKLSKCYTFKGKSIQIYYSSEQISKIVHPALGHYEIDSSDNVLATFDIYLKNDDLYLFKDGQILSCASKYEYHHIQGKFTMHLLCALHGKAVEDWIGTIHGSTITDGKTALLFVGKSGKGKSTLCTLLAKNGFDLLADDVSPLLSEDKHIYYNPSGISTKAGAFDLLKPLIPDFETLPIVTFNKAKGQLKYIPCNKPEKDHYPCRAIILVNYTPDSDTLLEPVSIKAVLETLIPDSWLSPNPKHAQQFIDWLSTQKLYQLTYSDTKSVTSEISTLFKHLN